MSLHRRAAKRDAAEPEIVKTLEAHGCIVWRVSGKGLPDLIVLRAGKKWLADVKGPKEKATPAQEKAWEAAATRTRCAVFILRTPEDAVAMLNNALAPWEPAPPRIGNDGRLVLADLKGNARMVEVARRMRANEPVYGSIRAPSPHGGDRRPKAGDAARARAEAKDRARAELLASAYTPPRSNPVDASGHLDDCDLLAERFNGTRCTCAALKRASDAAKEAEVFAPAAKRLPCLDPDKMNGAGDQFPGIDYD